MVSGLSGLALKFTLQESDKDTCLEYAPPRRSIDVATSCLAEGVPSQVPTALTREEIRRCWDLRVATLSQTSLKFISLQVASGDVGRLIEIWYQHSSNAKSVRAFETQFVYKASVPPSWTQSLSTNLQYYLFLYQSILSYFHETLSQHSAWPLPTRYTSPTPPALTTILLFSVLCPLLQTTAAALSIVTSLQASMFHLMMGTLLSESMLPRPTMPVRIIPL